MKEKTKNILCYGDSNTFGFIPQWKASPYLYHRYAKNERWTGILASELGDFYNVIEEGLGGRTTEYILSKPPFNRYTNGLNHIVPILMTHTPLDLVIIMLGTNDLQSTTPPDTETLGKGISDLIDEVRSIPECGKNNISPPILVISPIHIKKATGRPEVFLQFQCEKGERLSKCFAPIYAKIAKEKDCFFLDAALYAAPSDADGIHFEKEGHRKLGLAIASKVKEILNNN